MNDATDNPGEKETRAARRRVPREGVLEYPGWVATIKETPKDGGSTLYSLAINGRPSGDFKVVAAAVKYAREAAKARFSTQPPVKDTLANVQRSREGSVVPSCWNGVPEGSSPVQGRGFEECPTCPYRFNCASPEESLDLNTAKIEPPKVLEPEETFIERIQRKLAEKGAK